jgi:hypothetical protein
LLKAPLSRVARSALEFSEFKIRFYIDHKSAISFPVSQGKKPLPRQLEKMGKEKPRLMTRAFLFAINVISSNENLRRFPSKRR